MSPTSLISLQPQILQRPLCRELIAGWFAVSLHSASLVKRFVNFMFGSDMKPSVPENPIEKGYRSRKVYRSGTGTATQVLDYLVGPLFTMSMSVIG